MKINYKSKARRASEAVRDDGSEISTDFHLVINDPRSALEQREILSKDSCRGTESHTAMDLLLDQPTLTGLPRRGT